jgi:hypothetical protein
VSEAKLVALAEVVESVSRNLLDSRPCFTVLLDDEIALEIDGALAIAASSRSL